LECDICCQLQGARATLFIERILILEGDIQGVVCPAELRWTGGQCVVDRSKDWMVQNVERLGAEIEVHFIAQYHFTSCRKVDLIGIESTQKVPRRISETTGHRLESIEVYLPPSGDQ